MNKKPGDYSPAFILEFEYDTERRHDGQLVYAGLGYTIKIEYIFTIINIQYTGAQLNLLTGWKFPGAVYWQIEPVIGRKPTLVYRSVKNGQITFRPGIDPESAIFGFELLIEASGLGKRKPRSDLPPGSGYPAPVFSETVYTATVLSMFEAGYD